MKSPNGVPALVVRQWLPEWDKVTFDDEQSQRKPEPHFYLLSMPAATLRSLSGIQRRDASQNLRRADDLSVQRRHDESRSAEIRRYIRDGFPLSTLSPGQRARANESSLRKPGWLPSAVIVNVLAPGEGQSGQKLDEKDAVSVETHDERMATLSLPESWTSGLWDPAGLHPIEVIDGQHRLWAFDQTEDSNLDFELPVVAFYDLDTSWQAYLFWTVNIKPKRINSSLAFDLYPLLREQDWLKAGEGVMVYRETRAQELTEALWSSPESPWFRRINMLGDTGLRHEQPVTQAAFVKSLTTTFVRAWFTPRTTVGGLFGGGKSVGEEGGLNWPRVQQAALLVASWRLLNEAVAETDAAWATELREVTDEPNLSSSVDQAFSSQYSLLASDQGVRPVLSVFNDLLYVYSNQLKLRDWVVDYVDDDPTPEEITGLLHEMGDLPVLRFLADLCTDLAEYDWRNSKAPKLDQEERSAKLVFRGSGGYKELRRQLLEHLQDSTNDNVADAAARVANRT